MCAGRRNEIDGVTKQVTHLADLTPDPHNARKHNPRNVGMIERALGEVGAARSIVIDEDGVVLAGNATIEAAAQAGIERVVTVDADGETIVAVRRSGLTDEQKRRLALYDNRTAEVAEWDTEQLQIDFDDGLLDGMFSESELDIYFNTIEYTSTDRDGQGVNSTWSQVDVSNNVNVVIGEIETRIDKELYDVLYSELENSYNNNRTPFNELFSLILRVGIDEYRENSRS